jgi:hypothetical protein
MAVRTAQRAAQRDAQPAYQDFLGALTLARLAAVYDHSAEHGARA